MRKLLLVAVVALFSMTSINAQTFKLGATAGVAVSDASDVADWALGIDAYYYFTDVDAFIEIGGTAGFRNFFMSNSASDDVQFLPVAAAARLKIFGILSGGADVGYAVGINSGNDGGFYYRPVIGVDILDTLELNASYEGTTRDGVNWGNLNFGFLFQF